MLSELLRGIQLNSSLNKLIPSTSLIDTYVERNTPSRFPFIRKVFKAYLKSLYASSEIEAALSDFYGNFNPEEVSFVPKTLSKTSNLFNDSTAQMFLMWSRIIKNETMLKTCIKWLFGTDLYFSYGTSLSLQIITNLDQGGFADTNLFTDMDHEKRIIAFVFLSYTLSSSPYSGLFTKSDIYTSIRSKLLWFSNIIPGRIPFFPIYSPCLVINSDSPENMVVSSSPFLDPAIIAQLRAMTEEQIRGLYTKISGLYLVTTQILQDSGKIKRIRIIQETLPSSFTIKSGSSDFPDIKVDSYDLSKFYPQKYLYFSSLDILLDFN